MIDANGLTKGRIRWAMQCAVAAIGRADLWRDAEAAFYAALESKKEADATAMTAPQGTPEPSVKGSLRDDFRAALSAWRATGRDDEWFIGQLLAVVDHPAVPRLLTANEAINVVNGFLGWLAREGVTLVPAKGGVNTYVTVEGWLTAYAKSKGEG